MYGLTRGNLFMFFNISDYITSGATIPAMIEFYRRCEVEALVAS
jgi:hypothetical protein